MDTMPTPAQRFYVAQQWRQQAMLQNVPLMQVERPAQEIIAGSRDQEVMAFLNNYGHDVQPLQDLGTLDPHAWFSNLAAGLHLQAMPQMPPVRLPPAFPGLPYIEPVEPPMPVVPVAMQADRSLSIAPHVTNNLIQFPGGSAHHQTARANGRLGNGNFSYSSSSTTGSWSCGSARMMSPTVVPATPICQALQPQLPLVALTKLPSTPMVREQTPGAPDNVSAVLPMHLPAQPHQESNPAPKNDRLHNALQQQLQKPQAGEQYPLDEDDDQANVETYFSYPPGAPDI